VEAQIIPVNFDELADEIKTIYVETRFNAEWSLLEGYHAIGKLLHNYKEQTGMTHRELCAGVGQAINKKSTSLFYAMKFYERFNDINMLPEGKNVSWRGVCHKYLTAPKAEPPTVKGVTFLKDKPFNSVEQERGSKNLDKPMCFLHPDRKAVYHHFPRTKGAGGTKLLPLCGECHGEAHSNPYVYWCGRLWENRYALFNAVIEESEIK